MLAKAHKVSCVRSFWFAGKGQQIRSYEGAWLLAGDAAAHQQVNTRTLSVVAPCRARSVHIQPQGFTTSVTTTTCFLTIKATGHRLRTSINVAAAACFSGFTCVQVQGGQPGLLLW
jgi:hypothetical protein